MHTNCAGECGRETDTYTTPAGEKLPPGWDWIPGTGARCPHCIQLGTGLKIVPPEDIV